VVDVKRTTPPVLMTDEALDQTVDELLSLAARRGEEIRQVSGRITTDSPKKPEIGELLQSSLRSLLRIKSSPPRGETTARLL